MDKELAPCPKCHAEFNAWTAGVGGDYDERGNYTYFTTCGSCGETMPLMSEPRRLDDVLPPSDDSVAFVPNLPETTPLDTALTQAYLDTLPEIEVTMTISAGTWDDLGRPG